MERREIGARGLSGVGWRRRRRVVPAAESTIAAYGGNFALFVALGGNQGRLGERERFVSTVRMVRYRLSILLLAGVATGCTHSGKTDQSVAPSVSTGATAVAAAPEAAPSHVKRTRAAPANLSAPRPQIDEVIGWDETKIKTVFGAPETQEDHAPTKRWVYHARQCTLNLTFYPEVETREFHALNYEVNSDDGSAKRQQACVAEFSSRLPANPLSK